MAIRTTSTTPTKCQVAVVRAESALDAGRKSGDAALVGATPKLPHDRRASTFVRIDLNRGPV